MNHVSDDCIAPVSTLALHPSSSRAQGLPNSNWVRSLAALVTLAAAAADALLALSKSLLVLFWRFWASFKALSLDWFGMGEGTGGRMGARGKRRPI